MKKNSIKKRKIKKDCWDLDRAFLIWLSERLPIYLKDAGSFVDLTFYKFTYKDKEYTQEELIQHLLNLVRSAIRHGEICFEEGLYEKEIEEILDIWKMIFHYMWW